MAKQSVLATNTNNYNSEKLPSNSLPSTAIVKPSLQQPVSKDSPAVRISLVDSDFLKIVTVCAVLVLPVFVLLFSIDKHLSMLYFTIAMSGAMGGVLYSARNAELVWPRITGNSLQLGWIADLWYGVAGAFAVYLIIPNFSEGAVEAFSKMKVDIPSFGIFTNEVVSPRVPPNNESGVANNAASKDSGVPKAAKIDDSLNTLKTNQSSADVIEVVALSLLGGFAGRSVVVLATMRMLGDDLRRQMKVVDDKATSAVDEAQKYRNELSISMNAIELVIRQINPLLQSPDSASLREAIVISPISVLMQLFHLAHRQHEASGVEEKQAVASRIAVVLEFIIERLSMNDDSESARLIKEVQSFLGTIKI